MTFALELVELRLHCVIVPKPSRPLHLAYDWVERAVCMLW
jgi:hypothetical protein